jgi:hypothetical protein
MGHNARERAEREFSQSIVIDAYIQALDELARKGAEAHLRPLKT